MAASPKGDDAEFLAMEAEIMRLRGLAKAICAEKVDPFEDEFIALMRGEDKDSLSRIRRYYSRRSFADLRLEQLADDSLRQSLTRLAEAIRAEEVGKVIGHELPTREGRALVRPPPLDDAQLSFFVPSIHDAPIKDDFNLMDIAPFALSKTAGEGVIRYELKDSIITVEGGAQVGLATAYDYDIVISMIAPGGRHAPVPH
jgi:hypothetical protein